MLRVSNPEDEIEEIGLEDESVVTLEKYKKFYAMVGFRTKLGIEVCGLTEVGDRES